MNFQTLEEIDQWYEKERAKIQRLLDKALDADNDKEVDRLLALETGIIDKYRVIRNRIRIQTKGFSSRDLR